MNKVLFHHLFFVFCFIVLLSGCSKDNDPGVLPCSTAWATDLQNELSAVTTAIAAYTTDQSTANCDALKAAYQDYIDALKPYGNCATLTGQNRTDWQKALSEAEDNIASMC